MSWQINSEPIPFSSSEETQGGLTFGPLAGYEKEQLCETINTDTDTGVISKKSGGPVKAAWYDDPPEAGQAGPLPPKPVDPEELVSWDQFTQSTTFHGVKYIFGAQQFKLRRYASL